MDVYSRVRHRLGELSFSSMLLRSTPLSSYRTVSSLTGISTTIVGPREPSRKISSRHEIVLNVKTYPSDRSLTLQPYWRLSPALCGRNTSHGGKFTEHHSPCETRDSNKCKSGPRCPRQDPIELAQLELRRLYFKGLITSP